MIDRTLDHIGGDCYIVTGDIAPDFKPLLFKHKSDAVKYAKTIESKRVWPEYNPTIEWRYREEMFRMELL